MLQLLSDSSWFSRKRLLLDGHLIYRRGRMAGIDTRFELPEPNGAKLQLVNEPVPGSVNWRPALYLNSRRVPELATEVPEPTIVPRPREFSIIVAVALLCMFVCITSFGAIEGVIRWTTGESGYPPMANWLLPFACTAPCLAGYWDMRRWGPVLLACFLLVEAALRFAGWADVPMSALVLQGALVAFGFAYYGRMR